MRPNEIDRKVTTSGVLRERTYNISTDQKDRAQIMALLRQGLYTDPILAVLREYGANGWDAHRSVGKHNLPIQIHLPTSMSPTLTIRDFGPGLNDDGVFDVFTTYGRSPSRESDDLNGSLGCGAKSGFAYSDSFTVTSWHDGWKRIYNSVLVTVEIPVLNEDGSPALDSDGDPRTEEVDEQKMQLLYEESCDPQETGIEVSIAVRSSDVWDFTRKARKLYRHFRPQPDINVELTPHPAAEVALKHGTIEESKDNGWYALMGCNPYRIDMEQFQDRAGMEIFNTLKRLSGTLQFEIGDVTIAGSREALRYTKGTKKKLIAKFEALIEEFVIHSLKVLKDNTLQPWDARCRVQVLNHLKLPVPKEYKPMVANHVRLDGPQTGFVLVTCENVATANLSVADDTRILIQDDSRALKGFALNTHDVVAKPLNETTVAETQAAVQALIAANNLQGLPIVMLSTLAWQPPVGSRRRQAGQANKKHRVRSFVLDPKNLHREPKSKRWEITDRVPEDTDVFIVMSGFKATTDDAHCGGYGLYSMYSEDAMLARNLGVEMPPVYGYKTTKKKPIAECDCQGTPYQEWRVGFIKSLLTSHNRVKICQMRWSQALDLWRMPSSFIATLSERFGVDHPLVILIQRCQEGKRAFGSLDGSKRIALKKLAELTRKKNSKHFRKTDAERVKDQVMSSYPLLAKYGLDELWDRENGEHWLEYVEIMDLKAAATKVVAKDGAPVMKLVMGGKQS